jgi:hypothetical protein
MSGVRRVGVYQNATPLRPTGELSRRIIVNAFANISQFDTDQCILRGGKRHRAWVGYVGYARGKQRQARWGMWCARGKRRRARVGYVMGEH